MRKLNPENEMAKRAYLAWLEHAKGRNEATADQAIAAINAFEAFNRFKSFKTFRREQAISFKAHLVDLRNGLTRKPLAKATLHSRVRALQAFFEWLAREPGYRKALVYSDAAYFGLTANDTRIATARREPRFPSLQEVIRVLEHMPSETLIQRRDRAVVAFAILSGARDRAIATMRLKHVDLDQRLVHQDAREVGTKRAKTFTSSFLAVGDLPEEIVRSWIVELRQCEGFGADDPLFPACRVSPDLNGAFSPSGVLREHWKTAAPIRAIFGKAFPAAGLPYYPPHSLRKTLGGLMYELNLTPIEMKAWSQSLGHDSLLTTLTSYGDLSLTEQSRVMAGISPSRRRSLPAGALMEEIQSVLAKHLKA